MRVAAYLVLPLIANSVMLPVGNVLLMLIVLTFNIPYLGKVLFVAARAMRFVLLFKITGWCISASGTIVGYLVLAKMIGQPRTQLEWIALAISAGLVTTDIANRIIFFDTFEVVTETSKLTGRLTPKFVLNNIHRLSDRDWSVMVRQNFTDQNFMAILQFLSSLGLVVFVLSRLNVIHFKGPTPPSLVDCEIAILSIGGLSSLESIVFVGPVWIVIRFFAGIMLWVWAAVFLAFSMEALPKPIKSDPSKSSGNAAAA